MKWLQKEGVRYALLLVVLLAIAAIAVAVTLNYLESVVPHKELTTVTIAIWALTMGFMLIAGAFGLWAVTFAAEAESLRRLSSLVDAMTYISDGVVALDPQGKAVGLNPAAVAIFGESARNALLTEAAALITPSQIQSLLHSALPIEIETALVHDGETRTLRIRSQPSKGIVVLLVSDVTALVRTRERTRRTAYFQLVGHMAKGVANDFNDLLCGISGHAALLTRQNAKTVDIPASAAAIQDCANRGMLLARQLMQLSGPGSEEAAATAQTAQHVSAGIDLLQSGLPASWTIDRNIEEDVAPVNIPPLQIEHLVHSLGFVAADASPAKQFLEIRLSKPADGQVTPSHAPVGAVLTLATGGIPADINGLIPQDMASAGVIASVINSLIQQAGGRLERFATAEGIAVFRVLFPEADAASFATETTGALALGLEAYAANWHILIDRDISGSDECIDHFRKAGIHTVDAKGIVPLLGAIENSDRLDALALSTGVLGDDQRSLLKAISKLTPRSGIVVQQSEIGAEDGISNIVYIPTPVSPAQLLHAIIEARGRIRSHQQVQA